MDRPASRLPDASRWQRLSPLVDELLDLDGDARAARLAELTTQHPDLADELARLVGAHDSAHGERFLGGAALAATDAEAVDSLSGLRLGAYTLVAPLGQGGAGSVWRARRDDGRFEGEVAIKLLHLALVGAGAAQRFRREGAILAKLAHPHIARLLDAGIGEVGQPYLVLELVDGERIDIHCDERRLTVERRLALFDQVLDAVAHAHRHLVIHRDLKSTNILATHDGQVKLLDFGIAKLLDEQTTAAEATQLTREGGRALTPGYAAPEQLRGDAVTTATDVYALGVLLYELLVGRHPTTPPSATGAAEAMRATLEVEPAPLASAWRDDADGLATAAAQRGTTPAALARLLRGDLARIVARCLRKEPVQRYASVDALAEDLRRWRAREPISARPDSLAYRTGLFVRRHRGAVLATSLAGAAIVAGIVGTVTQARRAEQQARQAQIERDNALSDLQFANASRDLLSFVLGQAHDKSLTGVEMLERAETLAESQFADDPLPRGRLQLTLGIEYGHLLDSERARRVLLKALDSANAAKHPALVSNVECLLASNLNDLNRPDEALPLFDRAIARQRAAAETQDTVLAACYQMRADLHAFRGRPQAMLEDAQAALALLGTPRADQRVLANSLQAQVAEAHGRLGQVAEAIGAYERAVAELEGSGRGQTTRAAIRLNNFGRMLYVAGLPRRAEEVAARGVALIERMGGELEVMSLARANRVRALIELGRLDEARRDTEAAFERASARGDRRVAGIAALYGAPAWCAAGQLERCSALVATARELAQATMPATHPNRAAVELAAAQLALAGGRPDDAFAALQRADTLFAAASEKSPLAIRTLALLAGQALRRGDVAGAAAHAQAAVDRARDAAHGLAGSMWLGEALAAQAAVRQAQGDAAGARASLEEADAQLRTALGDDAPATRTLAGRLAAAR